MSFQLGNVISENAKEEADRSSKEANIQIKCRTELTSYFKESDHSNNSIYFSEVNNLFYEG